MQDKPLKIKFGNMIVCTTSLNDMRKYILFYMCMILLNLPIHTVHIL